MNGSLEASAALVGALAAGAKAGAAEMLVCPPFVFLDRVRRWIGEAPIALGAQNLAVVEGTGA
jgi:triosephosphate isomerase